MMQLSWSCRNKASHVRSPHPILSGRTLNSPLLSRIFKASLKPTEKSRDGRPPGRHPQSVGHRGAAQLDLYFRNDLCPQVTSPVTTRRAYSPNVGEKLFGKASGVGR